MLCSLRPPRGGIISNSESNPCSWSASKWTVKFWQGLLIRSFIFPALTNRDYHMPDLWCYFNGEKENTQTNGMWVGRISLNRKKSLRLRSQRSIYYVVSLQDLSWYFCPKSRIFFSKCFSFRKYVDYRILFVNQLDFWVALILSPATQEKYLHNSVMYSKFYTCSLDTFWLKIRINWDQRRQTCLKWFCFLSKP